MGRTIVVGGSVGGVTTVEALRDLGHVGEIVLVESAPACYQRPPVSKEILLGADPGCAELLTAAGAAALGVDLRVRTRASGLDVGAHRLRVGEELLDYDDLVLASGVCATDPLLGSPVPTVRTPDDGVRLRALLTSARSAVVLGGGVLASEIASAATSLGVATTIVSRGPLTLGPLRGELAARLTSLHADAGVRVLAGRSAVRSLSGAGGSVVQLDDGARLRADVVVAATGVRPDVAWLEGAVPTSATGVVCDDDGRVAPGVWVVGDAADRCRDRWSAARATQSGAIAQARTVAARIARAPVAPEPTPYFWTDVHGVRVQGLGTFPPTGRPLDAPTAEDPEGAATLVVDDDLVVGAVAWGSFRAFRQARARLGRPATDLEVVPA